jgi:hypothetical protein
MLLIHGFSGTWAMWTPLLPALEQHHDVLATTLLGHFGGPEYLAGSPATPAAIADALEREMDSADDGWPCIATEPRRARRVSAQGSTADASETTPAVGEMELAEAVVKDLLRAPFRPSDTQRQSRTGPGSAPCVEMRVW